MAYFGGYPGNYQTMYPQFPQPAQSAQQQNGYSGSRYMMYGRDRRDGGYSRTDIREHLTQMMNDAPDENTRGEIRRMIDRMDNQR